MRTCALLGLVASAAAQRPAPARPYPFDGSVKMRDLPIKFSHAHTAPATKPGFEGSLTSTYMSPPMPLLPGEVVFTNPYTTQLEMPTGPGIAIQAFHAEIVDDMNVSTPLSEVYNHHWLIFDHPPIDNDPPPKQVGGNGGVCGGYLSYIFGVGAEGRNSPVDLPGGHGYITTGKEQWSANIHLLRTVDLANGAQGTRDCIECAYAQGKGCRKDETGRFACCGDGSFCPVLQGQDRAEAKTYFLRYTVTYTTATAAITPITNYVLDASACEVEYNIAENAKTGVHRDFLCFTYGDPAFPVSGDTPVFAAGHQHIGAINITLSRQRDGESTSLCTSVPTRGTEVGVAGNEKGYVTAISHCAGDDFRGMDLKKGDNLCIESFYDVDPKDTRFAPLPGGAHLGVMSLFYLVVA